MKSRWFGRRSLPACSNVRIKRGRLGAAWRGEAGRGAAGEAWPGEVWRGLARQGAAWPGRLGRIGHQMSGAELKALRKTLGLSLAQAARQVEVSARSFARWESGAQNIPEGAIKLFKLLNNIA